jgi:hypothetical protein
MAVWKDVLAYGAFKSLVAGTVSLDALLAVLGAVETVGAVLVVMGAGAPALVRLVVVVAV